MHSSKLPRWLRQAMSTQKRAVGALPRNRIRIEQLEDRLIPSISIALTNNRDGNLGSGASLALSSLSVGTHMITLMGTADGGAADDESILLEIQPVTRNLTLSFAEGTITEANTLAATVTRTGPTDAALRGSLRIRESHANPMIDFYKPHRTIYRIAWTCAKVT